MINTDNRQRFGSLGSFDIDDRMRKCGVDGINRNRIVRICGIARDIGDHRQLSQFVIFDIFEREEQGSRFRQVDTVDENIG